MRRACLLLAALCGACWSAAGAQEPTWASTTSTTEFRAAINNATHAHVVLSAHLNFAFEDWDDAAGAAAAICTVTNATSIVQGDCSEGQVTNLNPPFPPFHSLGAGQCVLVTRVHLFEFEAGSEVLLTKLYIRTLRLAGPVAAMIVNSRTVYVTHVTVQGLGARSVTRALDVKKGSRVLFSKSRFDSLKTAQGDDGGPVARVNGVTAAPSTLLLDDCKLSNNTAEDLGLITLLQNAKALVQLRSCVWEPLPWEPENGHRLAKINQEGGFFYSDPPRPPVFVRNTGRDAGQAKPLSAIPPDSGFLTDGDWWLAKANEAVAMVPLPGAQRTAFVSVADVTAKSYETMATELNKPAEHIELGKHLNLEGLRAFQVRSGTLSIRGNCDEPDPASFRIPATTFHRQCMIRAQGQALQFERGSVTVLQRLYFQAANAGGTLFSLVAIEYWNVWLREVTFQGEEGQDARAMDLSAQAKVLCSDCVFLDLEAEAGPLASISNSTLAIYNSKRSRNVRARVPGKGLIDVTAGTLSGVLISNSSVSGDTSSPTVSVGYGVGAQVFSDNTVVVGPQPQRPLEEATEEGSPRFLFMDTDERLQLLLEMLPSYPAATRSPFVSDGTQRVLVISLCVVGAVLLLAAAAFVWKRRYHRQKAGGSTLPAPAPAQPQSPMKSERRVLTLESTRSTSYAISTETEIIPTNVLPGQSSIGLHRQVHERHTASTLNTTTTGGPSTFTLVSQATTPQQRVEFALDSLRTSNTKFMGKYSVQSSIQRRVGGQGLVQFMRLEPSGHEVATKFYFDHAAFLREKELYSTHELRVLMPQLMDICANDAADPRAGGVEGFDFPPCIVAEKGESLLDFAAKAEYEFITVIHALLLVAKRLAMLHDSHWVHRDLKPGNILRMPQAYTWALIDFGCCAKEGTVSKLMFSIHYAAPEVVAAWEAGQSRMTVHTSLDMWSLGVMAWELLTQARVFPIGAKTKDIQDLIMGRKPLPWEQRSPAALQQIRKLRRLKTIVFACLERDPAKRPSAAEVVASWNQMFDSLTGDHSVSSGQSSVRRGGGSQAAGVDGGGTAGGGWTDVTHSSNAAGTNTVDSSIPSLTVDSTAVDGGTGGAGAEREAAAGGADAQDGLWVLPPAGQGQY